MAQVKPPFGTLNATLAKTIAANSPQYRRIVEPFGDGGTFALYFDKRRPREHVVNIVDPVLFAAMSFVQTAPKSQMNAIKRRDWTGSQEAFDAAMAVTATDGPDFFYRFLYTKKFGMSMKPGEEPTFDILSTGKDGRKHLWGLPLMQAGLKRVQLVNGDPFAVLSGGQETFTILLPKKPEDAESAKSRLASISGPFFFAAKVKDAMEIVETAKQMADKNVTAITAASIMMNTMLTVWNYESDLEPLAAVIGEESMEGM